MKSRNKLYPCPVCGYDMKYPPSDFNICPSCGTEFGYSDSGTTYENLRKRWIARGLTWHSKVEKPPKHWNPWLRLRQAFYSGRV